MRPDKRQLREEIAAMPRNIAALFLDLLEIELEEARLELENSQEAISIWRSQGRCMQLRNLMSMIRQGQKHGSQY